MGTHMIRGREVNLHQLRLFTAVVRMGSFTQAAREHYISQSALSSQIHQLATSIGTPLFTRVHGSVIPSEAGQRLFAWADSLLQHADTCAAAMARLAAAAAEPIVVGVSPTGAFYPLVEALQAFRLENHGLPVRLAIEPTPALIASLSAGTLDLALDWEPLHRDDLVCRPLVEAEFFIVASPLNPVATRGELAADTFVASPFLTLRHGIGSHSFVEATLARLGLWPRTVTYLPSIDDVKRAVAADLGFGLVSELGARQELQARRLVPVRLAGFSLRRRALVVHRREPWRTPAVADLVDFLTGHPAFRP